MKTDGHLGRNFLKGRHGDQANAVLAAVGYNFRLILNWLRLLLRGILEALLAVLSPWPSGNPASYRATDDALFQVGQQCGADGERVAVVAVAPERVDPPG